MASLARPPAPALIMSLSAIALACGSPPPPAEIPDSARPPKEAAIDCPPSEQFARDWFHTADLESGRSCLNYLEQDECILAVFDDCTTNTERQWAGRVDRDRGVQLTGHHPDGIKERCEGLLLSDLERVELGCTDRAGLFFEKVDRSARPFAMVDGARRFQVGDRPDSPTSDLVAAALVVDNAGTRELWTLVASGSSRQGVLHVIRVGSGPATPITTIPVQYGKALSLSPDGRRVALSAGDDRDAMQRPSVLHLIDVSTHMIVETATHALEPEGLAFSPDGASLYLALEDPVSPGVDHVVVEKWSVSPLRASASRTFEFDPDVIEAVRTRAGATRVIVAGEVDDTGQKTLVLLGDDLSEKQTHNPRFDVTDFAWNPTTEKLGMVSANAYVELDPESGALGAPVPVPYFSNLIGLEIDAKENRAYVLGLPSEIESSQISGDRGGLLAAIDLGARRAMPGVATIEITAKQMVFDRTAEVLYVISSATGRVEVLVP